MTITTKRAEPTPIPVLPADLDAGLRRLKLATIRRDAPEVLLTAKTQRWTPEEVLLTLIEAEIASRDRIQHREPPQDRGIPRREDPR